MYDLILYSVRLLDLAYMARIAAAFQLAHGNGLDFDVGSPWYETDYLLANDLYIPYNAINTWPNCVIHDVGKPCDCLDCEDRAREPHIWRYVPTHRSEWLHYWTIDLDDLL